MEKASLREGTCSGKAEKLIFEKYSPSEVNKNKTRRDLKSQLSRGSVHVIPTYIYLNDSAGTHHLSDSAEEAVSSYVLEHC